MGWENVFSPFPLYGGSREPFLSPWKTGVSGSLALHPETVEGPCGQRAGLCPIVSTGEERAISTFSTQVTTKMTAYRSMLSLC